MEKSIEETPGPVPEGYKSNGRGYLVPIKMIQPRVLLQDEMVAQLCGGALAMRAQLAAFRRLAFEQADAFLDLLAQEYEAKRRSASNTVFESFDGLLKVELSTGHFLTLGPELESAKSLIDECLADWSQGANDNLRAIVNDAFRVGEAGKLQVDRVLALRRVEIIDAKWKRAMEAISDAVKVSYSKRYMRFYQRANFDAPWQQITLDVARV